MMGLNVYEAAVEPERPALRFLCVYRVGALERQAYGETSEIAQTRAIEDMAFWQTDPLGRLFGALDRLDLYVRGHPLSRLSRALASLEQHLGE